MYALSLNWVSTNVYIPMPGGIHDHALLEFGLPELLLLADRSIHLFSVSFCSVPVARRSSAVWLAGKSCWGPPETSWLVLVLLYVLINSLNHLYSPTPELISETSLNKLVCQ